MKTITLLLLVPFWRIRFGNFRWKFSLEIFLPAPRISPPCRRAVPLLDGGASLPSLALASREKVKAEPMVTENLNSNPWRASAWQKSMHWEFREELSSLDAVILANYF